MLSELPGGKGGTNRDSDGGICKDSWGRAAVNREIMLTCHTFQYGSQKSSGVVPRKRQLRRGKRSLYMDNDASLASIDREGPGALWEGHRVALTASHACVVFAWAANHLKKECTPVRRVRQAEPSWEWIQQALTHRGWSGSVCCVCVFVCVCASLCDALAFYLFANSDHFTAEAYILNDIIIVYMFLCNNFRWNSEFHYLYLKVCATIFGGLQLSLSSLTPTALTVSNSVK